MSMSMNTKQPARRTYTAAEDRALAKLRAEGGFIAYSGMTAVERNAFRDLTKRGLAAFVKVPFPGFVVVSA